MTILSPHRSWSADELYANTTAVKHDLETAWHPKETGLL